jgi:hypothetical protein
VPGQRVLLKAFKTGCLEREQAQASRLASQNCQQRSPTVKGANPSFLSRLYGQRGAVADVHFTEQFEQLPAWAVPHWTLTTLQEKLMKIGAKVLRHAGGLVFQLAEWRCRESCFEPF